MPWITTEDGRRIYKSDAPLMSNYPSSAGGNLTSGAAPAQLGANYGVNLPNPVDAVRSTVGGVLGSISNKITNNRPSAPKVDKKKQFGKGEIFNKYGNYSKSNAAKEMGVSKDELKKRAKAAGYSDTESYYKAFKAGKFNKPNTLETAANAVLGGIPAEKVNAEGGVPTNNVNQGIKNYGMGNWGTPEMGITENPLQFLAGVASRINPITSMAYDAFMKDKLRGVGGGNTNSLAAAPNNGPAVESYLAQNIIPFGSSGGITAPATTAPTGGITSPTTTTTPTGATGTGTLPKLSLGATTLAEGTTEDPFAGIIETQGDLTEDQIAQLQLEYDKLMADYGIQRNSLTNQYGIASTSMQNEGDKLLSDVEKARLNAESGAEANIQNAYETANTTQRANRNVLRALGILGSSAAGDILSRPQVAADKVAATERGDLASRLAELDNTKIQVGQELATKKAELDNSYMTMLNQIDSDIRFGEQEKLLAVEQLKTAYADKVAQLEQQGLAWNNTLAQQQQAYQLQLAQLLAYTNPSDMSGILSSQFRV